MSAGSVENAAELADAVIANDNRFGIVAANPVVVENIANSSSRRTAKLAIMTTAYVLTFAWTSFLGWGIGRIVGLW